MKGRMRDKNGGKKKRLQKNWVYRYQKNLEERYNYDRRQCFIGYYTAFWLYHRIHFSFFIFSSWFAPFVLIQISSWMTSNMIGI